MSVPAVIEHFLLWGMKGVLKDTGKPRVDLRKHASPGTQICNHVKMLQITHALKHTNMWACIVHTRWRLFFAYTVYIYSIYADALTNNVKPQLSHFDSWGKIASTRRLAKALLNCWSIALTTVFYPVRSHTLCSHSNARMHSHTHFTAEKEMHSFAYKPERKMNFKHESKLAGLLRSRERS